MFTLYYAHACMYYVPACKRNVHTYGEVKLFFSILFYSIVFHSLYTTVFVNRLERANGPGKALYKNTLYSILFYSIVFYSVLF